MSDMHATYFAYIYVIIIWHRKVLKITAKFMKKRNSVEIFSDDVELIKSIDKWFMLKESCETMLEKSVHKKDFQFMGGERKKRVNNHAFPTYTRNYVMYVTIVCHFNARDAREKEMHSIFSN